MSLVYQVAFTCLDATLSDTMSGGKSVKVIVDGGEQRRIRLPGPDIGKVKAEICRRFDVQADISISAIVSEEGQHEEYAISSSDDLQDLWEEFKELRVTAKQIDSSEKLSTGKPSRVVFNKDRKDVKLINFTQLDIEDIKKVVCERFFAEKVSLAAVIKGDSDEYTLTTNDDVKELWESIDELHVTGKKKRLDIDMKVAINREQHSIDEVPARCTAVVRKARRKLRIIDDIEEVDKSFRRMGTVANIAYYAAVATGNHDLQVETKQLGFSAIEICHAANNTVQSYVITCGTVNETFHTAIMYLLENDYDRALRMISSLEGTAKECSDKTENLIVKIDKVFESKILSKETGHMILKERQKAEDFEKEQAKKQLELEKLALEPVQIKEPTKSTGQKVLSVITSVGGAILGAVGATSVPKFLISAARGLFGTVKDQEEDDKKKEAAERKRQEKERKKQAEAEKYKLQLNRDLQDLRRDIQEADKNDKCFHILGGELLKMRSDLQTMKSFFKDLLLFCQAIKKSEEQIMANMAPGQPAEGAEVAKVNCRELFESQGFKEQLVNYMAKWVAIEEACVDCRDTLKNTKRQLHEHIEKNPTKAEARRDIDSMIEDVRKNL